MQPGREPALRLWVALRGSRKTKHIVLWTAVGDGRQRFRGPQEPMCVRNHRPCLQMRLGFCGPLEAVDDHGPDRRAQDRAKGCSEHYWGIKSYQASLSDAFNANEMQKGSWARGNRQVFQEDNNRN